MLYVFEKREGGILEGGYRGCSGGGHKLEGEEGERVTSRIVGGQGFQAEVQASYHSPQALG